MTSPMPAPAPAALTAFFRARAARLRALQAALVCAPATAETLYERQLVARALYSTWLDLEALTAYDGGLAPGRDGQGRCW